MAIVKARASGSIGGLAVRAGDAVTTGQVLARIESTECAARREQVQRQADAAAAQGAGNAAQLRQHRRAGGAGFHLAQRPNALQSNLDAAKPTSVRPREAVIGSVLTSSLLTLVVVLVVYGLLDDFAAWLRRRWQSQRKPAPARPSPL